MGPEQSKLISSVMIGLDIGTSSAKAIAITRAGKVLSSASRPYALLHPQPGYAEQDPNQLLQAALDCLSDVLTACTAIAPVSGISISTAMHSIMALDAGNNPITPLLTWADTRSIPEAEELRVSPGAHDLYTATGVPIHPMSPLCKLAWLRKNRPEIMAAAHRFAGIKEYLLYHLTGEWIIDHSTASATGLFDIHQQAWNPIALSIAGIHTSQLAALVEGTRHFRISPAAGLALGNTDLAIFPGGADGCLANLGSGAMEPGLLALTIGTSGAVRMTLPQPVTDPMGRLFSYPLLPGSFVCGGPVNNGGVILKWFSESILGKSFNSKADFRWFMEETASIPPGAAGLVCAPWFLGERAPLWNAKATGTFHGCTVTHTRAHLMRALVEGISFNLRQVADILTNQTVPISSVLASGGFTASPQWVQLIADVFQVPVRCTTNEDASATGAAKIGFIGIGAGANWRDFETWTTDQQDVSPDPSHREAYAEAYARYCAVADWASQSPLSA